MTAACPWRLESASVIPSWRLHPLSQRPPAPQNRGPSWRHQSSFLGWLLQRETAASQVFAASSDTPRPRWHRDRLTERRPRPAIPVLFPKAMQLPLPGKAISPFAVSLTSQEENKVNGEGGRLRKILRRKGAPRSKS